MKRLCMTVIVAAALLGGTLSAHGGKVSELTDVRYAVQDGISRVTLAFSGEIRFSTEQTPQGLRLAFSRTRPAVALNPPRRTFTAGHVQGMTVSRLPGDSLVVILTLVQGSTYRCVSPPPGTSLLIDLQGGTPLRADNSQKQTPRPARTNVPAVAQASASQSPSQLPVHTQGSFVVDIPAVVRQQVSLVEDVGVREPDVRSAPAAAPGISAAKRLLVSVVISGISSVLLLVLWVGRSKRAKAAARMVPTVSSVPRRQTAGAQAARPAREGSLEEYSRTSSRAVREQPLPDDSEEEDPGRETSLQLARTFRRGSEEISLARKFQEHTAPSLTPARMETVLAKATTGTQRLQAARKLGVGRGEFDLAAKLRSLHLAQGKKEKQP